VTPEAVQLLASAAQVEAACALEAGLPARAAELARALVELLRDGDLAPAPPRALWNLLWLAGDLTMHVDVYRAEELLGAVERLFERHLSRALDGPGEAQAAAEMAFDFFFNREAQPLVSLRFDAALAALERVLKLDNRFCRRAALHGLGHLHQHAEGARRERIEAVIDAFLADVRDPQLAGYAAHARAGDVL
jgi:hypothetical protein